MAGHIRIFDGNTGKPLVSDAFAFDALATDQTSSSIPMDNCIEVFERSVEAETELLKFEFGEGDSSVDSSDPSAGLLPMESLRPVDPSDPSAATGPNGNLLIAEFVHAAEITRHGGNEIAIESIEIAHEGWEL